MKNFEPMYKCPECRAYYQKLNCSLCGGTSRLTGGQYIAACGVLGYGDEIPYCHVCGNDERADIRPYAVAVLSATANKILYRCIDGHGHDQGQTFIDPLTWTEWRTPTFRPPVSFLERLQRELWLSVEAAYEGLRMALEHAYRKA